MDWNLAAIAVLLTLCGLYLLESELSRAPLHQLPAQVLKPARTALERAWLAEPVQVFMRQLLAVRERRQGEGHWHPGKL